MQRVRWRRERGIQRCREKEKQKKKKKKRKKIGQHRRKNDSLNADVCILYTINHASDRPCPSIFQPTEYIAVCGLRFVLCVLQSTRHELRKSVSYGRKEHYSRRQPRLIAVKIVVTRQRNVPKPI